MFVVLGGVVFLAWGEVASLFPTTCADYFGNKYATTNAGLLYTAKGTAAMTVPLASPLTAATGNWQAVFWRPNPVRPANLPAGRLRPEWPFTWPGFSARVRRST